MWINHPSSSYRVYLQFRPADFELWLIEGVLREEGIVVSRPVVLFYSETGEFREETTTSAVDGSFQFQVPNDSQNFDLVFFDPVGTGIDYDPVIFRDIVPVFVE